MSLRKKYYDFSEFALFEKYGVLNFDDYSYQVLINQIVQDIFQHNGALENIYFNDELVLQEYKLEYSLDWCKSLFIFYDFNNDNVDSFTLTKKEFESDGIKPLFAIDNNSLSVGSIVIKLNKSANRTQLRGILLHEIKHLYYYLKTKISTDKSNKDILYQEGYEFSDGFDFFHYIREYYRFNNVLDSLSETEFKDIFVYILYYLNLNECRSMIENINNEIRNHINDRYLYLISKRYSHEKDKDLNVTYLIRLSETFAVYYFILLFLTEIKTNNRYLRIYNNQFKDDFNDIYGVNSLNKFCDLMIERVNKEIVDKAYKLLNHYK